MITVRFLMSSTTTKDFGPSFGHLTPAYYPEPLPYGIEVKARP
jgi:hypothetical protein